jgi:hypothetical protein
MDHLKEALLILIFHSLYITPHLSEMLNDSLCYVSQHHIAHFREWQ